jgi:hypothetical protein
MDGLSALLHGIESDREQLAFVDNEAKKEISKADRRELCRQMHVLEQRLAASEERLDAIVESRR